MKLLVVTSGYPPDHGGLEAHVSELSEGAAGRGIDVTVVAFGAAKTASESTEHGVRVLRFPVDAGGYAMRFSFSMSRWLRQHTRDYDVVHAHQFHALPALLTVLSRPRRLVFTPHYNGAGHSRRTHALHKVYRPAGRLIFRRADAVICVSRAEGDLVTQHFSRASSKITVIRNGVNVAPLIQAEAFDQAHAVVLTVGRLERYKSMDIAIEAMAHLPDRFQLTIVGEGPDRDRLISMRDRLGLGDRVALVGGIDTETLWRWYRTAAVYVSLSTREAFGIAALEAAAGGARVIVSDIPAHRDVFRSTHPGAAMLLPTGCDPRALAHTIEASERLGRSDDIGELPTWDQAVSATLGVYERLLGSGA